MLYLSGMKHLLIKSISNLLQVREEKTMKISGREMSVLPCIEDAWLEIKDGIIYDYGKMDDFNKVLTDEVTVIDASGKIVLPCWVDSHTHIVYAGSRESEFVDRIKGLSYQEIAIRGGGILNSAKKLEKTSEEELIITALERINEMIVLGTGAIEIKSGYGLNTDNELKILRVIKKLKEHTPVQIKATFLGAHAIPPEYKSEKRKYIDIIINEMIPKIADEKLADYCDVFCERGYYNEAECVEILEAGKKYGLIPKAHTEQLSHSGGTQAAVKCGAISVDHLEYLNDEDIAALRFTETMPTILPGAQWFLSLPYPPARKIIDSGLPLAIASDYNPGSSPSGNMNFMLSLACVQYNLTPEEAINAATINSAYAINLSDKLGSIRKGNIANIIITKRIPSYAYIPYWFAHNPVDATIINGELMHINCQ